MAIPKFYLEKRADKKAMELDPETFKVRESNVAILLVYSFHGQRLIYYTGLRCDKKHFVADYWKGNEKNPVKSTAPRADYLNDQLKTIRGHLYAAETKATAAGMPLSVDYFRDYLNSKLKERPQTEEPMTLLKYFDLFIDRMKTGINSKTGHPLSPANAEKYSAVKNMLTDFIKHRGRKVDFNDVDGDFYNELVNYMIQQKKYALNTYGRQIKFLKTVLHAATREGVNTSIKFQSALVGVTEQADNAYLTEKELETIYKHDFSKSPHLDRVRDLFLIGCWTGLRFSDYTNIKREHITGDKIRMVTKKTKKQVVIPLHPTVKAILEKYNYELPPAISNQKFNDYIADVCKDAEINDPYTKNITRAGKIETISGQKWEFISSHSARRSFASNMFKRGVAPYLIMSITGHRSEAEFMKYLKITDEERADMFTKQANW